MSDDAGHSLKGALFGVLIGVVLVGGPGVVLYAHHDATTDTVAVDATVTSTSVNKFYRNDPFHQEVDVDITYRYSYEGQTYRSSDVFAGIGSNWLTDHGATEVIENHQEGSTVTAHVKRDAPSRAYLIDPGTTPALYVLLVVGLPILLNSLSSLLYQFTGINLPPRGTKQ
jgi:hypothetical protein